jgi:hypothetical protein
MTDALVARENRKRRGWVLRTLDKHRAPMNDALILDALRIVGHAVTMPTLHGDLQYLAEKGYVRIENCTEFGFAVMVVRLTAAGTDLLEGKVDPGVDLGHPPVA